MARRAGNRQARSALRARRAAAAKRLPAAKALCIQWARRAPRKLSRPRPMTMPNGQKTGPGHCSEQQLIAQLPPMINQAWEVFCQGRFPASLIYVLIVSPSPAVPPTFMPLPSRNTSAGRPVVPDTALLPGPFLPPTERETIFDFACPDGSALHNNAANIAAKLAAAKTLQAG